MILLGLVGALIVADARAHECVDPQEKEVLMALRERRVQLDQRESILKARELAIDNLRQEVDATLAAMQKKIGQLEERLQLGEGSRRDREKRLTALVETVSTLSAKKAAPLLSGADPSLVSDLLLRIGPQRSAALLALMRPAQAAKLVNQLGSRGEGRADASDVKAPEPLSKRP